MANHKGNEDEIKKLEKLHKKGTDELHVPVLLIFSDYRLSRKRTQMLQSTWPNSIARMSNYRRRKSTNCRKKRNCKRLCNQYFPASTDLTGRANILIQKLQRGSLTIPKR